MRLNEISVYTPMPADCSPAMQIANIDLYLGDIADIMDHARNYAVHECDMQEEQMDKLSSILRGGLSLLRDMGEMIEQINEMSKAWQTKPAVAAIVGNAPHSATGLHRHHEAA